MPLQKQPISFSFASGVDQKSDPKAIPIGKFDLLENNIFSKTGLLQKRYGNQQLASLSDNSNTYLTTFNGNLTAIGNSFNIFSQSNNVWSTKGSFTPLELSVLPLVRSTKTQTQADTAIASNGLVLTVYLESAVYKYAIYDTTTGQNIVAATTIATPSEMPRCFILGNNFIILWSQSANLNYIAIPVSNPTSPGSLTTLVTNYSAGSSQLAFDGVVFNNSLYISYNASDGGGAIRMTYMNSFLVRQTANTGTVIAAAKSASFISVCADATYSYIWTSFYKTAGTTGYVIAVDTTLNSVLAATQIIAANTYVNITSAAQNGAVTVFLERSATYSYNSVVTNFIQKVVVNNAGTITTALATLVRSVGLGSKAFIVNSIIYFTGAYSSTNQPTYFVMDSSANVVCKLAYGNGGGYYTTGLPSVAVSSTTAQFAYLFKDTVFPVSKTQGSVYGTNNQMVSNLGVNLATIKFVTTSLNTAEIGGALQLSGGFLWMHDGQLPVEQNFHLWPDNVVVTTATGTGSIAADTYYYQAVYEWSDAAGNIHRSAPSIPVSQVTTTASSTNTINIPTLRLTYKIANPVRIALYRWAVAQQFYALVTSFTAPTLNDTTIDSVAITDTFSNATLQGTGIIYTNGGVVEDIAAPATNAMALYKSRLFLVDAEDPNLLWFSKQVIEATPVEMSDLFTFYVAPTTAAQGNTGPIKALSALDDKLIIFKKNAIYYLVGSGPDNTGANNDFSDPVFITATVGCSLQKSIVFQPQGLMFQSDKGIWLLGRDLSTQYIGAPVENYTTSATVLSALNIPGTNQVRFTMDSGVTLVYDYYFGQWSAFTGAPAISATLYQDIHTFIDSYGRAFQELAGSYVDGSRPVLMKFRTGWINVAGLQGYERAYALYLLGTYISPHKLNIQVGYDYAPGASQSVTYTPDNYASVYGSDSLYGGSAVFGGGE